MTTETHRLGPSLHREVRLAGGMLDPGQAARLLLHTPGAAGSAARQVVLSMVKADPRLDIDDRGMVILTSTPALDLPLTRVEFVVVDVETTGIRPGVARLTEVGAVRIRNGQFRETFTRLVDPGLPVPSAVTRLTGISNAMLQGAPPFARIAVEWLEFLGNGVMVAHNALFDRSFLDQELIRCGETPPTNPVLCSVRLARRLLPDLRSHSLDSLARHFGLRFHQRHRALGDAEVTARILLLLLERAADRGLATLGALQKLQKAPVHRARVSKKERGSSVGRLGRTTTS